jgi:hypothetical protein
MMTGMRQRSDGCGCSYCGIQVLQWVHSWVSNQDCAVAYE